MPEQKPTNNPREMSKEAKQQHLEKVGAARLRAFAMGISKLCKEAGISYEGLAKAANVDPEKLAPALALIVAEAAKSQ